MSDLTGLLREAAEIRERYRAATSDDERAELKHRYGELEKSLDSLRERPASAPKAKRRARVSISKKESADGVALELLTICDTITTDGAISDDEIHSLKTWVERNIGSDLPAIAFLRDVIAIVLEDNVVTTEERKQIYKAIETVLPPDIRKYAIQKRKIAEALDKEKARAERKERREKEREQRLQEKQLNAPVIYADFMVAGVRYEGRDRVVRRYVRASDNVFLVRDPSNKFSNNAVQIQTLKGRQIGFVPEEWAEDIAPLLDQNYPYRAKIKKILTGGSVPIPVVVAEVFKPNTKIEGVRQASRLPARSGGCSGLLLLVAIAIAVALYLFLTG